MYVGITVDSVYIQNLLSSRAIDVFTS